MKLLTKIRLINWHYFVNETIDIKGSTLFSGENASGKSTILDAIKYVLTVNNREFNIAANDRSNRDLKGYVRCKTGNEGKTYARSGSVISFVALEFWDDKKNNKFVIGVKCDSIDEESKVNEKWFFLETPIDNIEFIKNNKPVIDKEFIFENKRVALISQKREAKERVQRRLGNVDKRFFELIPKALAFRPMENVKEFINKFVLQEKTIEIEQLRGNIEALKKFEILLNETKAKINSIKVILDKFDIIDNMKKEHKYLDLTIMTFQIKQIETGIKEVQKSLLIQQNGLLRLEQEEANEKERYKNIDKEYQEIQLAINSNKNSRLISKYETEYEGLIKNKLIIEKQISDLVNQVKNVKDAYINIYSSRDERLNMIERLIDSKEKDKTKNELFILIKQNIKDEKDLCDETIFSKKSEIEEITKDLNKLSLQIDGLKKNVFTYPPNAVKLKQEIEQEFEILNIKSKVSILCELLELRDESWRNAIEGYLNTQRFYLLVEPRYFNTALSVYNRLKKEIHSCGVINLEKIKNEQDLEQNSLANKVSSKNNYAEAYIKYLLGRVICCDDVLDLKKFPISITKDCMLYQGHVARRLDPKTYEFPFIGIEAYKLQLDKLLIDEKEIKLKHKIALEEKTKLEKTKSLLSNLKLYVIENNLFAQSDLEGLKEDIADCISKLEEAKKDPNLFTLQEKLDICEKNKASISKGIENIISQSGQIKEKINLLNEQHKLKNQELGTFNSIFKIESEAADFLKIADLVKKYDGNNAINQLRNESSDLDKKIKLYTQELVVIQAKFNNNHNMDFDCTIESIPEYREEKLNLERSTLLDYESKLKDAMDKCEAEFKCSFLAKMKENIENARQYFKELNKTLRGIEYGEERYEFILSSNKEKKAFYQMIMDDSNFEGITLFRENYEDKYRSEMEELFDKIAVSDDKAGDVVEEYTDYRKYLDYDIEVSKNGQIHKFSKIAQEKSGGETQTPFYVVIAASFKQIYNHDTTALIMFDEAFDKMDDNRISGILNFYRQMGFQILLATPPAKIEIIAEAVSSVLLVQRKDQNAFIDSYNWEENNA